MWKRLVAGFGGAIALNILHSIVKNNFNDTPDFKVVGEEAIDKSLEKANLRISDQEKLYNATVAGDIVGNTLYYTFTPFKLNTLVGALGGLGAMALPKQIGVDNKPIAGNDRKKMITMGYYVFGALVAGGIYNLLTKKKTAKDPK